MTTWKSGYPSDVTDDEGVFLAPHLTLVKEDATQRVHSLRTVFDAVRYVVRTGVQWRMLPNDLPPWDIVYQQARRWIAAGVFEAAAHDLREVMRLAGGKEISTTAVILDGRTLQSTPKSGASGRAGFDGAKKKKVRKSTSRSTRFGICWRFASRRQTSKSGLRRGLWRRTCKRSPAAR